MDDWHSQGLRALKRAKELIEEDKLEAAIGFLSIAANVEIGEAQYLLGGLLLDDDEDDDVVVDDDDDDDDDNLVLDAETKRRQNYRADDPQDIRSIRKSARKAYVEHLKATNSAAAAPGVRLGRKEAASVVQHATVSALDRAFGTTLKQFLDPKTKLRPLKDVTSDVELAQLDKADSTKAIEWIRRAADNMYAVCR